MTGVLRYKDLELETFETATVSKEQHVAEIERAIATRLPEDYRDFLMKYGPERRCIVFASAIFSVGNEEGMLEEIFGCNSGNNDVVDLFQASRDWVHPNIMPIGRDPGDNFICLGFQGDEHGKVYFWERFGLPDEDLSGDQRTTHFVSESFKEFMDNLKIEPFSDGSS